MAYCSIEAARDAGCTGTDAEVAAWIQAAREGIERYTQQVFEPTDLVVVADVGAGGLVILPRRVRTVTSVMPVLEAEDGPSLSASAYRVTSSAVLGQVDAVHLGPHLLALAEAGLAGIAAEQLVDELFDHSRSKRSRIRQPRSSAMVRRRASGLVATGWSTRSSSGRSLVESE